jgi:hypothetical protein
MTTPTQAQMERARRLLAHEGTDGGSVDDSAAAAGRVYDKLPVYLAPLVGSAGVQALLVRSAKLVQDQFPCLAEAAILESSTRLRECLRAQEPAVAREAAVAFFGTFFALITTFIGERLTTEMLRSAWPTIEGAAPKETRK